MKVSMKTDDRRQLFAEAYEQLKQAIAIEAKRRRSTVHPYAVLFDGTITYLRAGERLTDEQEKQVRDYLQEVSMKFPCDVIMRQQADRLRELLDLPIISSPR